MSDSNFDTVRRLVKSQRLQYYSTGANIDTPSLHIVKGDEDLLQAMGVNVADMPSGVNIPPVVSMSDLTQALGGHANFVRALEGVTTVDIGQERDDSRRRFLD